MTTHPVPAGTAHGDPATIRLSVLDQSPIGEGQSAADALRTTVTLAQYAEALGYHRYWLAEHHESRSFAGTAPEVLTGLLLQSTARLRVGTGGILLPRYHPDKAAETMTLLRRLHPGRVDVGIARGGGPSADFGDRLQRLYQRLTEPGTGATADAGEPVGNLWLLGAGGSTAPLAGSLGAGYAFGHFFAPRNGPTAVAEYRRHLRAGSSPSTVLAVRAVTAEDPRHAAALAQAMLLWRARKDLGHDGPIPTPTTAARHIWTPEERAQAAMHRPTILHGTPEQLHVHLASLARAHRATEIMINTLAASPEDRMASYELLAARFRTAVPQMIPALT